MAINLERVPKISDLHVWGDYIELLCLVSQDGVISKSDILDRLADQIDIDTPEIDAAEFAEHDELLDRNDQQERKAEDWFRHLEYRQGAFETLACYPFHVSPERDTLSLNSPLTRPHKLYIYLLIASNLRYLTKSDQNRLARKFEWVSHQAFKQCLPKTAEVYIFGTSGKRYIGNLWQKIQRLAVDLHETVIITEDKFFNKNVGDGGLDIVGWLPMGDKDALPNRICFFGQCACTDNWVEKQHSSSPQTWRSRMTLTTPPGNVMFIPHCFRDSEGNWWKPQDIHGSILFDRLRLIYLLRENYDIFEEIDIYTDVERLISQHEGLV